MATKEFYIRNASETDARGPFTIEQLISLAEAGQVVPETLYYEANSEQWLSIGDDTELRQQVFPEKKKLSIKRDPKIPTLNKSKELDQPIEVMDMLAAAEGRTSDTRDRRFAMVAADRCAKAGLYGACLILLLGMAVEVLPHIDLLVAFEWKNLVTAPALILGVIDLALATILSLGVVSLYPLIRFRAMVGLGFMGFIYFVSDQPVHALAAVASSLGLYGCTFFLSYMTMGASLLLGLGGMAYLAYMLILN
jgi:hypothetical protein